jgi:hypothetical protein
VVAATSASASIDGAGHADAGAHSSVASTPFQSDAPSGAPITRTASRSDQRTSVSSPSACRTAIIVPRGSIVTRCAVDARSTRTRGG